MQRERMERGSMETLLAMQENPLTYNVMLSELHKISVGSNGEGCLWTSASRQYAVFTLLNKTANKMINSLLKLFLYQVNSSPEFVAVIYSSVCLLSQYSLSFIFLVKQSNLWL